MQARCFYGGSTSGHLSHVFTSITGMCNSETNQIAKYGYRIAGYFRGCKFCEKLVRVVRNHFRGSKFCGDSIVYADDVIRSVRLTVSARGSTVYTMPSIIT